VDPFEDLAEALRRQLIERARDGGAGGAIEDDVRALVEREATALPAGEREALAARVLRLATGLGPLEPLLADPAVDEVMVNGPREVWVERRGRLEPAGAEFGDAAELMHAVERILAPLGRRVDEAAPLCDARLPDGSRVNVVIPPLGSRSTTSSTTARCRAGSPTSSARAWGHAPRCSSAAGQGRGRRRRSARCRERSRTASASSRSRTPPSCGCASATSSGSSRGRRTWRAGGR
jgi:hypothetical protein